MWSKWEERFKTFGAKRIQFETSRYGGPKSRVTATGAKCLLFFDGNNSPEEKADEGELLESIVEKILCNEVLEVTLLDEEDFEYQVKDKETNSYFGSRAGYPILKFFVYPLLSHEQNSDKKNNIDVFLTKNENFQFF